MNPFISIIIPEYKRNDSLLVCLQHLDSAAGNIDETIEIVVSDDNDCKTTAANLSVHTFKSKLSIIQGPRRGPAANRNNGAKVATGKWLLFIDNDCLPDQYILSGYINAIKQHKNISAFEGRIITDRPQNKYNEEAPVNLSGDKFWSCNICIQKDLFHNIEGFDENFKYPCMEDVDLFVRLKKNSTIVKFVPGAFVIHPWRSKRGWNGYMNNLSSIIYFHKKHTEREKLRFLYLKIWIKGLAPRVTKLAKLEFRGCADFLMENVFYFLLSVRLLFD